MSALPDVRAAEVADKLALLRAALAETGAGAIRLRGTDWFAWATAGGDSSVLLAADCGVAEVLVTREDAVVLTDAVEAERLRLEQVFGPDFLLLAACDNGEQPGEKNTEPCSAGHWVIP